MRTLVITAALCAWLPTARPSYAQAAGASDAQQLYHVHVVKAAPGKLRDLMDTYLSAPVPAGEQHPVVLRHREGDDWDLLVLTPYGKAEHVVSAAAPSADIQAAYAKVRANSERHTDSFAAGPAWSDGQKTFDGGANAVYVVAVYRALNGHRDQLAETLRKLSAAEVAGRTVTLRHVEGGPFDFIQITRYDSWNDIDADTPAAAERLRAQGFTMPDGPSIELRQHMAEHHDTICVRVTK
jgi:hypothetical protein